MGSKSKSVLSRAKDEASSDASLPTAHAVANSLEAMLVSEEGLAMAKCDQDSIRGAITFLRKQSPTTLVSNFRLTRVPSEGQS